METGASNKQDSMARHLLDLHVEVIFTNNDAIGEGELLVGALCHLHDLKEKENGNKIISMLNPQQFSVTNL